MIFAYIDARDNLRVNKRLNMLMLNISKRSAGCDPCGVENALACPHGRAKSHKVTLCSSMSIEARPHINFSKNLLTATINIYMTNIKYFRQKEN